MVSRWRCLRGSLVMTPQHATSVVLACCVLHNFLRTERCNNYCPPGYGDTVNNDGNVVPGIWREDRQEVFQGIDPTAHRNATQSANEVRETYTSYFSQEGSLPWQAAHVNRI